MKPDRNAPRTSSWRWSLVVLALLGGATLHAQDPKLLLAPTADDLAKAREADVLLRPNTEQTVHVVVRNPGTEDVTVVVALRAVGARTPVLRSKPLTVKPGEEDVAVWDVAVPTAVPGAPAAPAPAAPTTLELKDPARTYQLVTLVDNKEVGQARVVKLLRPLQYLDETRCSAIFDGPRGQLTAKVVAGAEFSGEPASVRLTLDPARIPGLVATDSPEGSYQRALTGPGKEVELTANNLSFNNQPTNPNGLVTVDVDSYERALTWRTTFNTASGNNQGQLISDHPLVRLIGEPYWKAGPKYPVTILVDNARRDLRVEIGVDRNDDRKFDDDEVRILPSARDQHIGVRPGGDGALTFATSVRDWKIDLDVAGLFGKRTLRVRLLNEAGEPVELLDEEAAIDPQPRTRTAIVQSVVYDGSEPDVTALGVLGLPAAKGRKNQLVRGKPLTLYARAEDEQTGIKEVVFFVGKPNADGTLPMGVEPVPGILAPVDAKAIGDARKPTWLAQLPVPTDKPGKVPVGVQVTNQAGMKSFGMMTIELVDPPMTDPKDPKSSAGKGGTIEGTVNEGGRLQPNVPVVLRDAQGNVKDTVRTDNRGRYVFKDVPAGSYRVQAIKSSSRTEGDVTVQAVDGQVKSDANITLRRP